MSVLETVVREHIRCDECQHAYLWTDPQAKITLESAGWEVDQPWDQVGWHVCPRCARLRREGRRQVVTE